MAHASKSFDRSSARILSAFDGQRPPAPAWFDDAIARSPERSFFSSSGASIELLAWGDVGKPGLLFLHGNSAHADWWSYIAPFFMETHRCAAISWSGMGRSDRRPLYSMGLYVKEVLDAIEAAGLAASGFPPVIVAHSFGGLPLMRLCADHGERVAAALLIDTIMPPNEGPPRVRPASSVPFYESEAEALARFRFQPAQSTDLPVAADHLARHGLRPPGEMAGEEQGWRWRFDPALWENMDRTDFSTQLSEVGVPTGLIYGEESAVITRERVASAKRELRDCRLAVAVPAAGHHIMADKPIALVSCLRIALAELEC